MEQTKTTVEQFLRLKAPFASFRPFQSGSYRSTTPVPSPSNVYGILLNLAGIEQRTNLDQPVTLIRDDLPEIEIAIAERVILCHSSNSSDKEEVVASSETAILSQQLHTYPVGNSGKELAQKTYGAKYWIAPVRREVLVNLDLVIGIRAEQELYQRIQQGLHGELDQSRYGLPFAGDNNFLFNEIEEIQQPSMARWYCPLRENTSPRPGTCRLTTWIDRADNTKTQIGVFIPSDFLSSPPNSAWISVPPKSH
jgi:CRISPR-associated protein Cas5t